MQCRLCLEDRKLSDSHIIPEFLYKDLYKNHRMMEINGRKKKGWKTLQKGVREKLLCADCESLLNLEYEIPFQMQWLTPESITQYTTHTAVYDYPTFKLFHLSILFRASVSSLPAFQEVNLGVVHEERIRKMILSKDPGLNWEYPIQALAVINGYGKVEKRVITSPISRRFQNHIAYGQIYGGAMWWIMVSSHRNDRFCKEGLQPSGQITMMAIPWNEIGVMQDASKMVKRAPLK